MFGKTVVGLLKRVASFKALATVAMAFFLIGGTPLSSGAEKVVFSLDWVPYGRDAGFFAAKAKGFLKEQGLTVKILRGKGSADSIKRLTTGKADYANPDAGTVVIFRAKRMKVKLLGAFHAKTVMTVVSFKNGPIQSLKDLEGRTCSDSAFSATHRVFPALARKNGVDPDKVKWKFMNPGSIGAAFLSGKVDCTGMYAPNLVSLQKGAVQAGKKLNVFRFADLGLDIYSNSMSATDSKVASKPDEVRRFLRGMYKGLAWSVKHPEEAVDTILKEMPVLNRDTALKHWAIAVEHLFDDGAKKNGIGFLDRKKVAFTRDIMVEASGLKVKPALDDLYTTAFLPKIMVKR
jgi:NitT/TauT family transport system substrate-binding protein